MYSRVTAAVWISKDPLKRPVVVSAVVQARRTLRGYFFNFRATASRRTYYHVWTPMSRECLVG